MSFVILSLLAFGIGLFWKERWNLKISEALAFVLGVGSIAPLLILLNAGLGLDFRWSSLALLTVAAFGFYSAKNRLADLVRHLLKETPLPMALLLYLGVVYVFDIGYVPRHWDEFSYWLTYPKQMLAFQSLVHPEFPEKVFSTYLPGLPAFQVLNQQLSLSNVFESRTAFNVNYLFIVAISWLLWDEMTPSTQGRALGTIARLSFFLLLLFSLVRSKVFVAGALVETSCFVMTFGFFWSFYLFCIGKIPRRELMILIFLFAFGGYALKEYFILIPGVIFIFLLAESYQNKSLKPTAFLRDLILCSSGLLLVMIIWKWKTYGLQVSHDFKKSLTAALLVEKFQLKQFLIPLALKRATLHFLDVFILIFPLLGLVKLLQKRFLIFWLPFLSFVFAYIGVLMWWYFFVATEVESLRLSSFERYLSYFTIPLFTIAYLHFIKNFDFQKSLFKKSLPYSSYLAGGLVGTSVLFNISHQPSTAKMELKQLHALIQEKALKPQQFRLLDQQDNGIQYQTGLFYSLDYPELFGKLRHGWAYSDTTGPNGYQKISTQDFITLVQASDVLWVRRSNPWLNDALTPYVAKTCTKDLSFQFLLKENGKYNCYPYEVLNRE